ncbi:MAG: hypothetical protein J6Y62_06065 [Clostridia bacterium]|nr:hypothetical protein [Clostridia bacterium]
MEESSKLPLKLLYIALADELLAWWQYWTCFNSSMGKGKSDADPEFQEHAKEEMDHADKIMQRIKELEGVPFNDPCDWRKVGNPWSPCESRNVKSQLQLTMKAEEDAIRFYTNAARVMEPLDITTYHLFCDLLKDEQKHFDDIRQLLIEWIDE